MSHLLRPYTSEEIRLNLDNAGYISGEVAVDLNDIIDADLEGFLDLISEKLTGASALADISYAVSGIHGTGQVIIKVTGDPSYLLIA